MSQPPASTISREPTEQEAQQHLQQSWEALLTPASPRTGGAQLLKVAPAESALPAPQQRALAMAATTSFQEPEEIRSVDGKLRVTLVVMKAWNHIGDDPVFLRSYNGRLVGPTLRAHPGETLYITLKNDLTAEPGHDGGHNTLHDFNTTNLHTHGLHVSPSGISDNVLLEIPPGATQEYEIVIPPDHPAGTFWYHAHKHGSTAAQVASGMSGALIIEGGIDTVPEIARARQRVFVLQQIAYLYKNCFPDESSPSGQKCFDLPEGVIEQKYEDWIFGPGTWDALGRFTTVNGVQLPVIRLRPGAVERWRLVDSGMRERIELKLESVKAGPGGVPATLPLHVIAEDGLPLGKVDTRQTVELWPGYRADVLVQAPNQPGEYLLLDERTAAAVSLNGKDESRKYIARVIVEGDPLPMTLPRDAELAPYRLKSIPARDVTGPQSAAYGILKNPAGGVLFTIDGKPFDAANVRKLKLGDVDEWTLTSINQVGAVSHPFHIHVNPFEVVSMVDDQGVEQLKEPIWRDTIILHEKWVVKVRTHYTDFAGTFVQHCHILDHEDQGMMELVEIVDPAATTTPAKQPSAGSITQPYAAPSWALPDATGKIWKLEDFHGHPTVLFFFKDRSCLHCVAQLGLFSARVKEFAAKGIQLVGVSTTTPEKLREALAEEPCPFPLLSDSGLSVFRQYHCAGTEPLHGTFLLDAAGQVRWQTIGTTPFTGVGLLFFEADKLAAPATPSVLTAAPAASSGPAVEVQVRNTATGEDDYIAWSPVACRIRQAPGAADLPIVLTNDPAQPVPAGRTQPLDGDVAFSAAVAPGLVPTGDRLALTLPKDGSWVSFVVAGKFPRASTQDKDTIIEVHQTTPDGPILQKQALMVRVRKDHRTLTLHERQRFLEALDYLNRKVIGPDGESRYMYFVRLHQAAAVGLDFGSRPDIKYYWPDLAHKGPGFIAWHRAFLLEFEREIQKTFPDVALPYWVMPEPSQLFSEDFMGANDVIGSSSPTPMAARFAADNPLYGWTADIDGAHNEPVQRFVVTRIPGPGFPRFAIDGDLFKLTRYSLYPQRGGFVDAMESNPHNIGHNWTGPWMQNCQTSPRDPIFWVFHAGFDRQWAHWQYLYGRFDPSGAGDSYAPLGDFNHPAPPRPGPGECDDITTPNNCVPITHRIADNLWPWSGKFGQGTTMKGSLPQADFAQPVLHPFPAALAPGLWPQAAAWPTPGDMIDYLGVTPGRLPMGFGYDDTPYGTASKPALVLKAEVQPTAPLSVLTNRKLGPDQRVAALGQLEQATPAEVETVLGVARTKDEDSAVRLAALRAAQQLDAPHWLDEALVILANRDPGSTQMAVDTIGLLSEAMMLSANGSAQRGKITDTFERALADPREPVRLAALWSLVGMGHSSTATALLTQSLQSAEGAPFKPADAIRGLTLAHQATVNAPLIRPYLANGDPALRALAVVALGGDAESHPLLLRLLADRVQPVEVRLAALRSLGAADSAALAFALDIAVEAAEPLGLRAEAIATLGLAARSAKIPVSITTLQTISQRLGGLPAAESGRLGSVITRTIFDVTRRLNSTQEK
ncbi:MAG: tyrosinase family protein [Verrucomicrobia bacterium]|nr:tyrosinase family protein [Verrucomicrobiota bacterium]